MWDMLVEVFLQLHPLVQLVIILVGMFIFNTGTTTLPMWFINKKKKQQQEHMECPNYRDHLKVIRSERSKGERIAQIKYHETVYEQMTVVRTVANEINNKLLDNYTEMLDKLDLSEKQRSDALITYKTIVEGAIDDASGYLRKWVKRNHLADMDDVQYQAYIHKRTEEAQKVIKRYIDSRYLKSQLILDRKEVYDKNMETFYKDIQTVMSDLFVNLRAISESSLQKIKDIEEE